MIKFENITFGFNNNLLYKNLYWEINTSENKEMIHFLLSPSGSGKSTLFKMILGLLKPSRGNLSINKASKIAYVPQTPVLFEHLSIFENVTFFKNVKARKSEFDDKLFLEFSKALGISEGFLKSDTPVAKLSGGQKRKLSLLKALSLNPNILLLDEPTTGLDAKVKMEVLDLIKTIAYKYGILVLYITHHFEEAKMIGDKIHYLLKGKDQIIHSISSQTITEFEHSPPSLDAVYLIDFPENRIEKGIIKDNTFILDNNGNILKRKYNNTIKYFDL